MARKPDNIATKIVIPAGITPINNASQFPSHYSDFGFGGLRTVDTITERDEIPALRRVDGMIVFVISTNSYYRLQDGIENSDWIDFSSGGGGTEGAGLKQFFVLQEEWVQPSPVDGTLRYTLLHQLGTENINVKWYQDGNNGSVFVPWTATNDSEIVACIPEGDYVIDEMGIVQNPGNAFNGFVRITAFLQTGGESGTGNTRSFEEDFGASKFTQPDTSIDLYEAVFVHNLNSNILNYSFFEDGICPNLLCVSSISQTTLTVQVRGSDRFAGRVFISRITE